MRKTYLEVLLLVVLAGAARAASVIVPAVDPVDGISWRGDQFYSTSELPEHDGHYDAHGVFVVRGLRWGFAPTPDGRWKVRLARTCRRATVGAGRAPRLAGFAPRRAGWRT